ncbi:MAG: branched-chain amino acid ABC transporter permease [Deltaproteobacteria bacterium]|nr:branched-chain amino acid ABC transporter permease [Deltaproteobacteria bacterium]
MKTKLAILLIVILLALLPVYAGKYAVYVVIHILLLSIFSLGFNLLFGYTGLLSFGQAGFYAVGAYGCAKILLAYPSLLVGILGGVAFTGVVSLALGVLCIRHTRIYFSMLTLSFGMMIFSLAWKWRDMTGGDDGLVGIPRAPLEIPGLFSVNMVPMENYYYVVLAFAFLAIALFYRLVHSPMGLTLQGIRDSETRTACIGISVRKYRLISFTIAGLYAGLAGALLPPLESTVTPPLAHWGHSAEPVLATLLGGIYSFSGPIVGSVIFYLLKDIIVRFTEYWQICLGIIVVVLVMGFRGGVASIFKRKGGRP